MRVGGGYSSRQSPTARPSGQPQPWRQEATPISRAQGRRQAPSEYEGSTLYNERWNATREAYAGGYAPSNVRRQDISTGGAQPSTRPIAQQTSRSPRNDSYDARSPPSRKIATPPARAGSRRGPDSRRGADPLMGAIEDAGMRGGDGSQASFSAVPPTSRSAAGQQRVEARDRWNTYEINIQEVFMKYDKDNSGTLESSEFGELLRDFNNGRRPTKEEYDFMMRLADKDKDGKINLGELHYAIRTWHSYNNLDDNILRLFAEFDTDSSGRLDSRELQDLLTRINGGILVPWQEVQQVMVQGDVLGDGLINRSELLGAISAWYAQVERKDTDLPALLREAVARAAMEHDYLEALANGARSFNQAKSVAAGDVESQGYDRIPDRAASMDRQGEAPLLGTGDGDAAPWLATGGGDAKSWKQRLWEASPFAGRSFAAFCYVAFPFIFNVVMIHIGWNTRVNECPRNLDGILLWFGILGFILTVSMYIDVEEHTVMLSRFRMALVVILAILTIVGILWTNDPDVLGNKYLCGHFLVFWSYFIWMVIPVASVVFACYYVAAHYRRLQKQDEVMQMKKDSVIIET